MVETALNGLIGLAPPDVLILDTGVWLWELGVSLSIALRDSVGVILLVGV